MLTHRDRPSPPVLETRPTRDEPSACQGRDVPHVTNVANSNARDLATRVMAVERQQCGQRARYLSSRSLASVLWVEGRGSSCSPRGGSALLAMSAGEIKR
jgi:hypothetical protein